jgi:putative two-component system response regulator
VLGFTKLAEARDPDTGDHIIRIAHYSRIISDELSKTEKYKKYIDRHYVEEMFLSAPLHEIGKVGIKDEILLKEDKLTENEFEIMKMHTIIGGNIISELERKLNFRSFFTLGKEIAYHHHQRFDGTGYPNIFKDNIMLVEKGVGEPLSGERIPLSSRIVALADVYDALISKRCYKQPLGHNESKKLVIEQSGKHFDPDVVAAFLRREREFVEVKQKFSK